MKRFIYTVIGMLIFVILPGFFIISNHLEKNLPGNDYTITNVSGSSVIQYQINYRLDFDKKKSKSYRRKSEWNSLRKGMKIGSDARIKVEKNAFADIMIDNGAALRIKGDSLVKLVKKQKVTNLNLYYGKVLCKVNRAKSADSKNSNEILRVNTPMAAAHIRGTSFSVGYLPNVKITNVEVLEGIVNLKSTKTQNVNVNIHKGKKIKLDSFRPIIKDITQNGRKELLETKELKIESTVLDRWSEMVDLVTASPLYKKALVAITKYEMKVFIRAIRYFAPLRWGNNVPRSLRDVELEDGDYNDSWNNKYFYEKIGSKEAIIISAGSDKILHTMDDIFMTVSL